MTSSRTIVLDALPYVEALQESYEEQAMSLLENEMNRRQPSSILPALAPVNFRTSLFKIEYEKHCSSQDDSFTFLPPPLERPETDNLDDWRRAVQEARRTLEHERILNQILEVDKEISVDTCKMYNNMHLEPLQRHLQFCLSRQQDIVAQINAQRQASQQTMSKELQILETQYRALVEKIKSLRSAVQELQEQVEDTKIETFGEEGK